MTEDTEEAMRVQTGSDTDANANPTVEFPPTLGRQNISMFSLSSILIHTHTLLFRWNKTEHRGRLRM